MKRTSAWIFSVLTLITLFALTAWLYPALPDQMPIHWNLAGKPDGFGPKPWGPFALPIAATIVAAVLALVPRISPRGFRVDAFRSTFDVLSAVIVGFLGLAHVVSLARAAGFPVSERWIPAGMGLMLALLGNRLGKTTKNFFVGIRTPWTLASDEVWLRTHRLGGKLFVIAGAIVFVAGLAGRGVLAIPLAVGVAALVPVIYSYALYRRLEGFASGEPPRSGSAS